MLLIARIDKSAAKQLVTARIAKLGVWSADFTLGGDGLARVQRATEAPQLNADTLICCQAPESTRRIRPAARRTKVVLRKVNTFKMMLRTQKNPGKASLRALTIQVTNSIDDTTAKIYHSVTAHVRCLSRGCPMLSGC